MVLTKGQAEAQASTDQGGSDKLLSTSADAFEHLAAVMQIIAEAVPARCSTRQVLAFCIIVYANAKGQSVTLSQVRETAGEGLGQSIEKTIQMFFAPSKQQPDALGWLEQEVDEDDRRKKYLKLTARGRHVANEITRALAD
ncbi:hypothetical protein [Phenylobacterium sp.]|uniref:hypothetical protein n=1 Tax=Phenylobacterium sp. TaxID=1871053 RepID=UPI003930261C